MVLSLERIANKSANNLLQAIANSKKISLAKFLYALGINEVGEETAKLLSNNYKNLDNLILASIDNLSEIFFSTEYLSGFMEITRKSRISFGAF